MGEITKLKEDITISWIRRSRTGHEWRDNIDVPLDEADEKYLVEIRQNERLTRSAETSKPKFKYRKNI